MKNIDEYIEAYFEGTLSESGEKRLKAFLSSKAGQAPEYDEIRAVTGYFAMGARDRQETPRGIWRRYAAVAAALILVAGVGMQRKGRENVCVAFVGNHKVADKQLVINDMEKTLADLVCAGPDVEQELSEFFKR